jgi:Ca-activated chloride channel homolog
MSLTRPALLWLLLILLPLLALERWRLTSILPSLRAIWGEPRAASWRFRKRMAAALRSVAAAALVLALAGPVSGLRATRTWTVGLDVAILLDVSQSMNALESGSTRLERAKREARSLMDRMRGGRFALCVFKGQAATLFPLTDDSGSIDEFLDSAGSRLLTAQGSDIAAGVEEALRSLNTNSGSARAIVLFSDGEALSGDLSEAAEAARAAGAPVHAIGMGGDEDVPVPDRNGVRSKRDRAALRLLCQSAGGIYADEENRASVLALYERLEAPLSPRGGRSATFKRVDASLPFILLACLALALSAIAGMYPAGTPSGARKMKRAGRASVKAARIVAALSILLGLFSGCERASAALATADGVMLASRGEQPRAIERFLTVLPRVSGTDADAVRYDLGLCYSAMGEEEAAFEIMKRAASSGAAGLSARSWYSLGCFYYMEADYREAFEAFKESLKREPGSRDAQINLELSWERMERDGGAVSTQSIPAARKEGMEGESEEFELIRQTERDRFKNAQETEGESDAKDY